MTIKLQQNSSKLKIGDLVHLVGEKNRGYVISLTPGKEMQSHLGIICHDDLVGLTWGERVQTHLGSVFMILQPALDDLLRDIKRQTQIMYPKDIAYILVTMGIGAGSVILECGTGSGAFTTALAFTVGKEGKIYSYENREQNQNTAKKNLELFGLSEQVEFKVGDAIDGFQERNIPAIFLDLPDAHKYIPQVRESLIPGGFFGCLLPTTNQVSEMITALKKQNFAFIEVSEILHRYYKPSATRLRPADKMVGHTGFLVFARRITHYHENNKDFDF
ncbi:MAG: tRNA (adenine-N1)-methyltransferase [Chloroflexi bacterium]|jgi:tRNA (adenine57-N1/adenine58-N1)-methyltransferase catalytic subunit|nr:tRNA (adenine-N1)-methyltransferase [Chloroflexota bacterium]MBT3669475.1 tRNA (adenine-N1)-methyltransferase [Chloroflexota bacterium]MBT4001994.1 tRNA (adenine-N1)-methyltransferase [Chloroflexota bacterium]MBT4304506.1 tRNA (adenine-N1)-methyltransferase [Chloroflexota bacterium]MBT4534153.1 tRNA (adenine-N1)-methyltransferase [Chloroflexota bacterium]